LTTTPSGAITITGNNNIVGNNNTLTSATTTGSNGATTTATTTTAQTSGSAFSGSNTSNLQQGLRNGTAVTLTGSGEPVTFTPPTGRMGNGEVDRAITLASRDLRQAGITNPTPEQLQAAMVGGTVTNAQGQTTSMDGVLTLRSQGMGWGQVAHTIGVHPSQSEQGALNSRRAAGSVASLSGNGERSTHALSASSDRNSFSQSATATGNTAASATTSTSTDSRLSTRSSDTGAVDTRIGGRDNGTALSAKNGGNADLKAGRANSQAATASAVSAESAFSGPGQAGPGAGHRSQASGKAKSGSTGGSTFSAGSAISGPGSSTAGSLSASAGSTSAGNELGGGSGKGNGNGKGK
jgi:hypothetical protein